MQMQTQIAGNGSGSAMPLTGPNSAVLLDEDSRTEVLKFLERRPIQTAMLTGLIRDNGLRNRFNRGDFYGCRNQRGEFEGVALIGHATLFETRSEERRVG